MISTTSLLVEHLISGFMAVVWIGLVVFCFYPSPLDTVQMAFENHAVALIGLAVFAYPIGMIVDNLADVVLTKSKRKYKNTEDYVSVTELIHHIKDENISSWFQYNRFKIRIMRACFLNSLISAVVLLCCLMFCRSDYAVPGVIFFIVLCVSSFLTWRKEVAATYRNVERWRRMIEG